MDRAQKETVVEEVGRIFSDAGVIVVGQYAGLTVAEMSDFRSRMKQIGGGVRVVKNRLAKIALEGKPCSGMAKYLKGQTVLAYSGDPVATAKVVDKFVKDNKKFEVVGGAMGAQILDAEGVRAVADMPSREELISSIVGMIMSPAASLVSAITAPGAALAGIAETLEKREAA